MGDIPRIHRVDPPAALSGQRLKVAQSGDKPGDHPHREPEEPPEDQVELEHESELPAEPAIHLKPAEAEQGLHRLDIAV